MHPHKYPPRSVWGPGQRREVWEGLGDLPTPLRHLNADESTGLAEEELETVLALGKHANEVREEAATHRL